MATTLMTYNLLDGGVGRIDPLAEVIRHAGGDIVACCEADVKENFDRLGDSLRMERYWAAGDGGHSIGLLSRYPLRNCAGHRLRASGRVLASVEAELPGGLTLPVLAVHLTPHLMLERETIRMEELEAVLKLTEGLRLRGVGHVLMGDFNAIEPGREIDPEILREADRKRLEAQGGIVPTRVIGAVLNAGYVDAYRARRGDEPGWTYSTDRPSLRLDYIFLWRPLVERLVDADVGRERLAKYASDHFPVWAEVAM